MPSSSTQIRPEADAPASAGNDPRPEHVVLATVADARLVRQYRRLGAEMLHLWEVPAPAAADVTLLISELVTNAVKHGSGAIRFAMSYARAEGLVVIDVDDGNAARPVLVEAGTEQESGRGMVLVDALSRSWRTTPDGTRTRCEVVVCGVPS